MSHITKNIVSAKASPASIARVFMFACAAGIAGAFVTGCSSTATSESTGEYLDSSTITTKVKSAFVSDKLVSASDVKVVTYKGIVQLSGFVGTQAEKDRAEAVARGVTGVKGVENNITVKPAQ